MRGSDSSNCPAARPGRSGRGDTVDDERLVAALKQRQPGEPFVIDGRLSAHWEHTILVTEDGHDVLTRPSRGTTA